MRGLLQEDTASDDSESVLDDKTKVVLIAVAGFVFLVFTLLMLRCWCRASRARPDVSIVRMVDIYHKGVGEALPYPEEQDRPLPRRNLARLSNNSVLSERSMPVSSEVPGTSGRRNLHKMRLSRVMDLLLPDKVGSYRTWSSSGSAALHQPDILSQDSVGMRPSEDDRLDSIFFPEIYGAGTPALTPTTSLTPSPGVDESGGLTDTQKSASIYLPQPAANMEDGPLSPVNSETPPAWTRPAEAAHQGPVPSTTEADVPPSPFVAASYEAIRDARGRITRELPSRVKSERRASLSHQIGDLGSKHSSLIFPKPRIGHKHSQSWGTDSFYTSEFKVAEQSRSYGQSTRSNGLVSVKLDNAPTRSEEQVDETRSQDSSLPSQ